VVTVHKAASNVNIVSGCGSGGLLEAMTTAWMDQWQAVGMS